jgi:hypothetical protein
MLSPRYPPPRPIEQELWILLGGETIAWGAVTRQHCSQGQSQRQCWGNGRVGVWYTDPGSRSQNLVSPHRLAQGRRRQLSAE